MKGLQTKRVTSPREVGLRLSIMAAVTFWLCDAVVDYLVHYNETFLRVLLFDPVEVSFRLLATVFFFLLGWIITDFFEARNEAEASLASEIAGHQHTQQALQDSESKYRALVESTDDSIYLVDREHRYLFMNRKHLTRLALSAEEVLGQPYGEFHTPQDTEAFTQRVNEVFEAGESRQFEHRSERDGRYFLQTMSPVLAPRGGITAVMVVSKHITDRKRMEEDLRNLSLTDDLTGLFNRRGFFALAEQQLRLAHRNSERIFMLYADLDNLKVINDTWGHQEGDIALIDTANLLRDTFRESDIIARIGGDEFVALPVGRNESSAGIVAARLQKNLHIFNTNSDRRYSLSLSVGIPSYDPAHPCSLDRLLARADDLMYQEKRAKKGMDNGLVPRQKSFPFTEDE